MMLHKFVIIVLLIFISKIQIFGQCLGNFHTQTEIDSFIVKYPDCDTLHSLSFDNDNTDPIKNLNGLRNIKYIKYGVELVRLPYLEDISGLDNVEVINGYLYIWELSSIKNFNGFKNLKEIGGSLSFNFTNFDSITGFGSLQKIGHGLSFTQNYNLVYIGHLGTVDTVSILNIIGNAKLKEINFISSFKSVLQNINISRNDSLVNINGLENINSAIIIIIGDNPNLISISGLKNLKQLGSKSYSNIQIKNNPKLTSLTGLENLDMTTVSKLEIADNPLLSYCHLENICEFISSPYNNATIIGNKGDCKTRQLLAEKCANPDAIDEMDDKQIDIIPNPVKNKFKVQGIDEIFEINIYDLQGNKVFSKVLKNNNHFDISELKAGIYLVRIVGAEQDYTFKIIKTD